MVKKIVFSILVIVVLVLIGGGFFYWQKNQADVKELNKTLPEGVKVVKSFIGEKYKVVNKIDGYEFEIPPEWKGVNEIVYTPERTEEIYTGTSLELEGKEGEGRVLSIDSFKVEQLNLDLKLWVENFFNTFGLIGDFTQEKVGELDIVKTQENIHLGGEYVYFFRKDKIVYAITGPSEEFIRFIITNGKW